jgi:hypothetical protein
MKRFQPNKLLREVTVSGKTDLRPLRSKGDGLTRNGQQRALLQEKRGKP